MQGHGMNKKRTVKTKNNTIYQTQQNKTQMMEFPVRHLTVMRKYIGTAGLRQS